MKKIVMFTSEFPGSGKTTGAEAIMQAVPCAVYARCKDSLHTSTMKQFGIEENLYWSWYTPEEKRKPRPEFSLSYYEGVELIWKYPDIKLQPKVTADGINAGFILSLTQAMIYVSEVVLKPIFGEDIFSKDRVKYCENYNPPTGEVLFVEDSFGFTAEFGPTYSYFGPENIMIIHVEKDGVERIPDSRELIPKGLVPKEVTIKNNNSVHDFRGEVIRQVTTWLNYQSVS